MSENDISDTIRRAGPTRRDTIRYGGAAVVGGLLAGCTGGGESDSDTPADDSAESDEPADSYEVCIEPTGCVELDSVPEHWAGFHHADVDIGLVLGVLDGLVGLSAGDQLPDRIPLYEELLDVSIDVGEVVPFWSESGLEKEAFYEANAEIHLIDRNVVMDWDGWSEEDVTEIETNVGPFIGSFARREEEFNEEYVYSLYELTEKYAELFQREERYEAIRELHDESIEEIQAALPDETPEVCRLFGGSEVKTGTFYLADPAEPGYENKHYHDLGVSDAFEHIDRESLNADEIDYETLLEVDPDAIIYDSDMERPYEEFVSERVEPMESHNVGSRLTAVQNERVFPGGFIEAGPIMNLFNTEVLAKQLHPETFGEFDPESAFDVPEEERLFDRQRVVDVINGEI